jgi:cytochrome P450
MRSGSTKQEQDMQSLIDDQAELIDFCHPDLLAEPHDFYAKIRPETPVLKVRGNDGKSFYIVTSYQLISEVTRRVDDFSNQMAHLLFAGGAAPEQVVRVLEQDAFKQQSLLVTDDPAHKRSRALVNAAFAQGRVANLAPTIDRLVDDLIDDFIETGECDFVNQFAVLLPTYVIADILGLERQDYHLVRTWSDAAIGIISRMGTVEQELANAELVLAFRRFILRSIALRRQAPTDDLISTLITARVDGVDPLQDDEIAPITLEIAVAGNETTRNTLMSGIVQLLAHPDQLRTLIDDPSLASNAVEEILRYETPATSMWRIAARDTQLGGVPIEKGAEILLRFDAANRDPQMFENPDTFDLRRKNALRHVAFGAPGIHRCLGQMLARKELEIALPKLLKRLVDLEIIADRSETAYWPGLLHRGVGSLHLRFRPGTRLRSEGE